MTYLNRKLAISYSMQMYQWVAEEESQDRVVYKWQWPRWMKNGGDIPSVRLHCFLCQYAYNRWLRQRGHKDWCKFCLYSRKFGTECCSDRGAYHLYLEGELTAQDLVKILEEMQDKKKAEKAP